MARKLWLGFLVSSCASLKSSSGSEPALLLSEPTQVSLTSRLEAQALEILNLRERVDLLERSLRMGIPPELLKKTAQPRSPKEGLVKP